MQYITLLLPGNRNSLHQSLDYLRITLYTLTHIPILMLTNIQSHTSISFSCFHAIKIKVMSILQCLKSFRCTNISFLPCRTTETGDYSKKWYGGLFCVTVSLQRVRPSTTHPQHTAGNGPLQDHSHHQKQSLRAGLIVDAASSTHDAR